MYKLLILLSFSCVVKPEVDIEWFKGKWSTVAQYPQPMYMALCQTMDFQPKIDVNCTCGDKIVPVVDHIVTMFETTHTTTMPVIIADSSAEVVNAFNVQCKCKDKVESQVVYRKINENVVVVYDKPLYLRRFSGESTKALVVVKTVPKLSQLREVLKNIDDLSQRKPTYLCEPDYFVSEFEDLD